ncbi:MAG: alpha/beta hydrolase [Tsuneonella sp.]
MRSIAALFLALAALAAVPVRAQTAETTVVEEWVAVETAGRFVPSTPAAVPPGIAEYGPFRVLDDTHAALVDVTDAASPAAFAAMLRAYPRLATLEMVECPGTDDDQANFRVGRMIRAAGLATHVPAGGSVRSGAVELFLAGATRIVDEGAEFAVHAWKDDLGREPGDLAADSPENRAYLAYYAEMGMPRSEARAFYAMTNSVPNADAKWLTAQDMRSWLGQEDAAHAPVLTPAIAYLDLDPRFP